jgi:hypothetical protein
MFDLDACRQKTAREVLVAKDPIVCSFRAFNVEYLSSSFI